MQNTDDLAALPKELADAIREYREIRAACSGEADDELEARRRASLARRDQLCQDLLVPRAIEKAAESRDELTYIVKESLAAVTEIESVGLTPRLRKLMLDIARECLEINSVLCRPFQDCLSHWNLDSCAREFLIIRAEDQPPIADYLNRLLLHITCGLKNDSELNLSRIRSLADALASHVTPISVTKPTVKTEISLGVASLLNLHHWCDDFEAMVAEIRNGMKNLDDADWLAAAPVEAELPYPWERWSQKIVEHLSEFWPCFEAARQEWEQLPKSSSGYGLWGQVLNASSTATNKVSPPHEWGDSARRLLNSRPDIARSRFLDLVRIIVDDEAFPALQPGLAPLSTIDVMRYHPADDNARDSPKWFTKKVIKLAGGHRDKRGVIKPMHPDTFKKFKQDRADEIFDEEKFKLLIFPSLLEELYETNDTRPD